MPTFIYSIWQSVKESNHYLFLNTRGFKSRLRPTRHTLILSLRQKQQDSNLRAVFTTDGLANHSHKPLDHASIVGIAYEILTHLFRFASCHLGTRSTLCLVRREGIEPSPPAS